MAKYEIVRWDPVVFGNNANPFPVIYIKPDEAFLQFAVENKNTIIVKIDGTNTIYDGKAMVGVVNPSGDTPNCRPNFFEKTGLFTISLYARWYEYPTCGNGTATITGLKGKYKAPPVNVPPYKPPVPISEFYDAPAPSCKNLSGWQVGGVALVFVVLFVVLLWISLTKKST